MNKFLSVFLFLCLSLSTPVNVYGSFEHKEEEESLKRKEAPKESSETPRAEEEKHETPVSEKGGPLKKQKTKSSHPCLMDALSFKTKNLSVRPLTPEDYDSAKAVDRSDASFVNIITEEPDALDNSLTIIKEGSQLLQKIDVSDLNPFRTNTPLGILYFGAFLEKELVGLLKFIGFYPAQEDMKTHYLGTDVKFHKTAQGKGYASEVYQALFHHFSTLKLIPTGEEDKDTTAFLGVHGLIHLTNKGSLKCLVFKCDAKIGRLYGDRVDIYYPRVFQEQTQEEFLPSPDLQLDPTLRPLFKRYLSRETVDNSQGAEEELYTLSFKRLMNSKKEEHFKENIMAESGFLIRALGRFPTLFSLISQAHLQDVNACVTEEEESLPPLETVPSEVVEKLTEFQGYLKKIREMLPKIEKPQETAPVVPEQETEKNKGE